MSGQKSGRTMKSLWSIAVSIRNDLAGLRQEKLNRTLSMLGVKKPEKKKPNAIPGKFPCRSLASG